MTNPDVAIERCPACRRKVPELHYSLATGEVCCERCHCQASPPASAAALAYRPPKPPPRPKPTRYAVFYDRVRGGLERLTGSTVFAPCDGSGRLLSGCPRCLAGVLCARLHDTSAGPVLAVPDGCTAGCSETQIAEVLFA